MAIHSAEEFAATPMQSGMVFESRFAPASGVNIEQVVCNLAETWGPELLRQCWKAVVDRYPPLRVALLAGANGELLQLAQTVTELTFHIEDWSQLTESEANQSLARYLEMDRQRDFEIEIAPLMRWAVFRRQGGKSTMVWTFHHAILDGRSAATVLQRVLQSAAGRSATLPTHSPDLRGGRPTTAAETGRDAVLSFWRRQLSGFASPTPLGVTNHPVDAVSSGSPHEMVWRQLDDETLRHVRGACETLGIGFSTMLLGAWSLGLTQCSHRQDLVFGWLCQQPSLTSDPQAIGQFTNTLPMRVNTGAHGSRLRRSSDRSTGAEQNVGEWLRKLRTQQHNVRQHASLSLADVQQCSDVPPREKLLDSVVVADRATLGDLLLADDTRWRHSTFQMLHQTSCGLAVYGYALNGKLGIEFDRSRFQREDVDRRADQLAAIFQQLACSLHDRLDDLSGIVSPKSTTISFERAESGAAIKPSEQPITTIHGLIQRQASRTPTAIAVACGSQQQTYAQLENLSTRIATGLVQAGLQPGGLVAVFLDRSVDMLAALLGVLKAGGAYVPLDPSSPPARLDEILQDAGPQCILTEEAFVDCLPASPAPIHTLERISVRPMPTGSSDSVKATSEPLAYVMYTSGSTGRPKGVMVTHRNVLSLFTAMEELIDDVEPMVWLAGTSAAFDISVVELLWPLTRGHQVIIETSKPDRIECLVDAPDSTSDAPEFSLFYFASDASQQPRDKYRLLLEGAQFADEHDFAAVWMPERHFHAFGGLFPNPSVTAAALATATQRIQLRAGSIVLPLHDPLRVAEEWSVVDNLSDGRVGLSFASGWSADDFALAPHAFADRRSELLDKIETVQKLWRGEGVTRRNGEGDETTVRVYPPAIQPDVPCWLTVSRNEQSFRDAGRLGLNLLTNLVGQSPDELAANIRIYREARKAAGRVGAGHVTLMLHTFVHPDQSYVRDSVREPLCKYLESAVDLIDQATTAWSYPAFGHPTSDPAPLHFADLSPEDREQVLEFAFERYLSTCGLFGSPESCLPRVSQLQAVGVDEIACLIDFGIPEEIVLGSLTHLDQLQRRCRESHHRAANPMAPAAVTHFQCTPSRLRMLLADEQGRELLASLRCLLVGGERFPEELTTEVCDLVPGQVFNMYGPTEATIWSTAEQVTLQQTVTIGHPLSNTKILFMDAQGQVVPRGEQGEICIAGKGVAAGYWNSPAATAERFVPHPDGEGVLYRTGDLGRRRPDDRIEFLGRVDDQVKILGHRVELGEIEAKLATHPQVHQAAVRLVDWQQDKQLVAYVEPRLTSEHSPADARLSAWSQIWNHTHQPAAQPSRYSGWISAYSGEPLAEQVMDEWLEHTVKRIRSLGARQVLEIGCGDGQLCQQLASCVDRYQAWDFSRAAMKRFQQTVSQAGLQDHVESRVAEAGQLADVQAQSLDLVIVNSTVQYFPHAEYLEQILRLAIRAVRPGGHVYVGDVRNLRLHNAFAADVEATRGTANREDAAIWQAVQRRRDTDPELLVAPEFFSRLQVEDPRLTGVGVELKRGHSANELNRFRYDVVLMVEHADHRPLAALEHNWRHWQGSPEDLMTTLVGSRELTGASTDEQPLCVRITGVPNRRVERQVQRVAELQGASVVEETRSYDPEDWRRLADTTNYRVHVTWTPFDDQGRFDVICVRRDQTKGIVPACDISPARNSRLADFTNRPAVPGTQLHRKLQHELQQYLKNQLPMWMLPSRYIFLDQLPQTISGKLARQELPLPALAAPGEIQDVQEERTALERFLSHEWCDLLGIEDLSRNDSFFALGGHSLLAVQLVERLRRTLDTEIPLRVVFETQTVQEMAAWLLRHEAHPGHVEERIAEREMLSCDEAEPIPLTLAQRRIWFLDRLNPGRDTYHVSKAVRVIGDVDQDCLRSACRSLAEKHDVLRTRITLLAGAPHQCFPELENAPFEVIDLRKSPVEQCAADVECVIHEASRQMFDLERGPLWRLILIRCPAESLVVAVMHHVITDGYSMELFFRELFDVYAQAVRSEMAPARRQFRFREFALRQQAREQAGEFTEPIRYWREHLTGAPPVLRLPGDAVDKPTSGQSSQQLPEDLRTRLQAVARQHNATMSSLLLATFALLLQRLSGQNDIVVGCPVAGRASYAGDSGKARRTGQAEDKHDLLGCFVNPLPLRLRRDEEVSFHEWFMTVRNVLFEGLAHQDFPFDSLVHELPDARSSHTSPLFQVMFNHLTFPERPRSLAGIQTVPLGYTSLPGKYELTLYVSEWESATQLDLVCQQESFSDPRMEEMLTQYVHLLEQIAHDSEMRLDAYTLVTPTSRPRLPDPTATLNRDWHGAAVQSFSQQCQLAPQATAVIAQEETSYEELDRASNRLARELSQSGVQRGDVVAIYAERCPALVVAMLAVHKIAAAFMIVDATHPAARTITQLRLVKPRGWIQLADPDDFPKALTSCLDELSLNCRLDQVGTTTQSVERALRSMSDSPLGQEVGPDELAYIAFTSGSTGRPLAVRCNHRALSHYLHWHTSRFHLGPQDRVTMLSGLSHDPLLRDVFAALWVGGAVCIPDATHALGYLDPPWLRDWFRRARISVAHLTPGVARILTSDVEQQAVAELHQLRLVCFAGEPLTGADVAQMRLLSPSVDCVNLYGTTETQQATGGCFVCPEASLASEVLPVGRGISDVQLLILNGAGQPSGIGEIGEIFIRTPYMADGYLGEPELTARKFIVNPETQNAQDRMVRTGDLGRYRPDGQVEFCGRRDRQVKVHGCRIEPAEIEAVIRQVSGVRGCLVLADTAAPNRTDLVAYIVVDKESSLAVSAKVRASTRASLPGWMCPRHIVPISEMPLTPNGKVDHGSLPDPREASSTVKCSVTCSAENDLVGQLTEIWKRVLNVSSVGVEDDFFALGGGSLDVVRLLEEVRETTGLPAPLATFYAEPTIHRLVEAIRGNIAVPGSDRLTWSSRQTSGTPLYFTHVTTSQLPLFASLALRLPGQPTLNLAANSEARMSQAEVVQCANGYVEELLRFQPRGPYLLAGYSYGGLLAYETAAQLERRVSQPVTVILLDSHIPAHGTLLWSARVSADRWRVRHLRRHLRELSGLNPRAAARYVAERVSQRWQIFRQPYRDVESFTPSMFGGNLLLFRAEQQNYKEPGDEGTNGWGQYVEGEVEVVETPGDHGEVLLEPAISIVADRLRQLFQNTSDPDKSCRVWSKN